MAKSKNARIKNMHIRFKICPVFCPGRIQGWIFVYILVKRACKTLLTQ